MKIRVTGTEEECKQAQEYYHNYSKDNEVVKSCSISKLYPNRNSVNIFRVYVDIECYNGKFGEVKTNAVAIKR